MSDKVLGNRFKGELSRVLLATLGIVLVVMLVGINYFSERFAKERLTRDLKMVGNILANRSASSLHLSDANQAIKNLASARYNRSIDRLCLYGDKGKLFATYLRNGANFLAPCGMTSTISAERSSVTESKDHTESRDKPIGIAVAVEKDGKFIGLLTIVGNLDSLKNDQNRMLSTLIIMFSMVALCAYLLIHLMLARSFKPLGSLYETTKLIAVDHFSGKRAVKFKQDEIGVLVDVFNKMLDSIDASHLKITESEERFRTLAASAPIGIFLMDAQLKRTYVNERWRELTGLDLESSREQYRNCISSKDLGRYLSMYHQLEKDDCKSSIEYQFNRRDSKIHGSTSLMEYIAPIGSNPSKGHLAGYVGSLLDVTDLRQARYELEKLAYYDPLTKLPNRRNFRDYLSFHIEKAVRDNGFLAVLMLDLDNFKRINDTLGHDAGDKVLIILSERLRKRLNPDDLVSRVGGDEFYLVLQEVPTLSVVDQMVKSVMEAASEPIEVGTDVVEVTASIGIARFPLDANSAEELMRNVDIALYRAKSSGKNQVAYFSTELYEKLKDKHRLESKLRKATIDGIMELYFQPQYNAMKKSFTWAEVLLRWRDEEEGFISPFKFIPLAEETGLITEIDYFVFKSACEHWQKHGQAMREVGIQGLSINLSARQFYSKQLISLVKDLLNYYDIDPSVIGFEITESLVIEDVDSAISTMKELMELGCKLSIDDFGTGYSSLSYLRRFPIDSFKIDKSFITDISVDESNLAITSAIIAMAEKLHLNVVAEGIETEEQKLLLLGQGCYMMQGYYFAKPMPIDQLLLKEWISASGHKSHRWEF